MLISAPSSVNYSAVNSKLTKMRRTAIVFVLILVAGAIVFKEVDTRPQSATTSKTPNSSQEESTEIQELPPLRMQGFWCSQDDDECHEHGDQIYLDELRAWIDRMKSETRNYWREDHPDVAKEYDQLMTKYEKDD